MDMWAFVGVTGVGNQIANFEPNYIYGDYDNYDYERHHYHDRYLTVHQAEQHQERSKSFKWNSMNTKFVFNWKPKLPSVYATIYDLLTF